MANDLVTTSGDNGKNWQDLPSKTTNFPGDQDHAKAVPCTCGHDNALMPENDAPSIIPPRTYMMTREQTERLVNAARKVCSRSMPHFANVYTVAYEFLEELQAAIDAINLDL